MSTIPTGPYTPPQWGRGATISITVPPQPGTSVPISAATLDTQTVAQLSAGGASTDSALSQGVYTVYVFDAVMELEHEQTLEVTNHPVQTGADINSHAYLMPARLGLIVGMSDVMAAFQGTNAQGIKASPFTGGVTKSVSAYRTVLSLQAQRALLTVTTRLRTYDNMIIAAVSPREDFRTVTGLRMRVDLRQILTGSASTAPLTGRADATQSSGLGQVQPQTVPSSTQNQFGLPSTPTSSPESFTAPTIDQPTQNLLNYLQSGQTVNTPGAGSYSSCPLQCLANKPVPQ